MKRKILVGLAAVLLVLAAIVAPAGAKLKKKFVPDLAGYVGPVTVDGHTQTQTATVTAEGHGYLIELEGELPATCAGGEEGLPLTLHGQAPLKGKAFKLVRKPAPSTHLEGQSKTVYVTVSGHFTAVNKFVGTARAETKAEAGDPESAACRSSTAKFALKVSP
jgi:hypothetical protein